MKGCGMLEHELAFYEAHKDEYLKYYGGQWVVIYDNKLVGAYSTEEQAYNAALAKVGNFPVLIQHVSREDEPVEAIPALSIGLIGGRP